MQMRKRGKTKPAPRAKKFQQVVGVEELAGPVKAITISERREEVKQKFTDRIKELIDNTS